MQSTPQHRKQVCSCARPSGTYKLRSAAGQRPVDHATWYAVMASFKLAVVLEGTNARAHAGRAPKVTANLLHAIAVGLLDNATLFIERGL